MTTPDFISDLAERVRQSAAGGTRLRIRGGGTKDFYGAMLQGEVLDVSGYARTVSTSSRGS